MLFIVGIEHTCLSNPNGKSQENQGYAINTTARCIRGNGGSTERQRHKNNTVKKPEPRKR
jgi:hypothetical protein